MCAPRAQQRPTTSEHPDSKDALADTQDVRAERARHMAMTTTYFDRDAAYFNRQYQIMVERGEAWPFPLGGYGFLG